MGRRAPDRDERLAAARERAGAIPAEVARLRAAPEPREHAVAAIDSTLDRLAAVPQLGVERFTRRGGPGPIGRLFLEPRPEVVPGGGGIRRAVVDDASLLQAALVRINREAVRAALVEELDAFYEEVNSPGLSQGERTAAVDALYDELWQVEQEEEAIVRELEGEGLAIARRPDFHFVELLVDAEWAA